MFVKKLATGILRGDLIGRLLEHNAANEPFKFQMMTALVAGCCLFSVGSSGTHVLCCAVPEHVWIAVGLLTHVEFNICKRLLEFRD